MVEEEGKLGMKKTEKSNPMEDMIQNYLGDEKEVVIIDLA